MYKGAKMMAAPESEKEQQKYNLLSYLSSIMLIKTIFGFLK